MSIQPKKMTYLNQQPQKSAAGGYRIVSQPELKLTLAPRFQGLFPTLKVGFVRQLYFQLSHYFA